MLIVSNKTKIRHRNGINKTLMNMPLAARRLLFLVIAQIDTMKIIKEGEIFSVSAKNYSDLCGVDIKTAYSQLKSGARDLHSQSLEIPQEELLKAFSRRPNEYLRNESKWRGVRLLHLTDSCSYIDDEAIVQVQFSRQMEPYICMIEKDFTTQILMSNIRLPDTNAAKLYQYLREKISKHNIHYFDEEIEQLKIHLEANADRYLEFKYFKQEFIGRSIKKLLEVTEFTKIEMKTIEKKGRKAHKVRVCYEYKNL